MSLTKWKLFYEELRNARDTMAPDPSSDLVPSCPTKVSPVVLGMKNALRGCMRICRLGLPWAPPVYSVDIGPS